MKFIKLDIYGSEFGINKVTQVLEIKGNVPSELEKETAETSVGKFFVCTKNDEQIATSYYADDEAGRKMVEELKVLVMMLKSKEMYGDYGWDVSMGRMYAQDSLVDESNWNEL